MPEKIVLPVGGNQNTPIPPVLTELKVGDVIYKLNDKGEAVDDKGVVLKTKEEIELLKKAPELTDAEKEAARLLAEKNAKIDALLIEGAEVELDGTKYKITKEGTILDKDGKVFKTKEQLRSLVELEDTTPDVNYISEIQKATNLIITGENNQPIQYENTVPGLAQYAQDVYKEGVKLGATQFQKQLFTQFPILQNVVEHLQLKGSLKDFVEEVDYSKITIGDDENQHLSIYTEAQLKRGIPKAQVDAYANYLKDDKKLKEAAIEGLSYLQRSQTERATQRASDIAAQQAAQDLEDTKYANAVEAALTSKELTIGDKKFKLPEIIKVKEADGKIVTKSIKEFRDYIEKPLNFNINGQIYTMTQHDYDVAIEDTKRTPHHDLFDAFRRFVKYDDSQLINANISSETARQVIKLKTKVGGGGSGEAGGSSKKLVLPIK